MSGIDALLSETVIQAVGWALLHFLWQGALVGALAALALRALAGIAADVRYVVAAIALSLMATMPVVTGVQAWRSARAALVPSSEWTASTVAGAPKLVAPLNSSRQAVAPIRQPERMPAAQRDTLQRSLPVIVLVWMAGVAFLALRLLGGWLWIQRTARRGVVPADAALQALARRLTRSLHISRPVRLLQSSSVGVPTVIGWLRPTVLLPISALAGLSPLQLEAIIAHELAHIRRHDYLVNLLQTMLETLLFYHPAVWWLSHRIRTERENCCDDLAVSLCGDPVIYARALADLEELRGATARLAMAASGGTLLYRVRRVLSAPATHAGRGPAWLAASAAVLMLAGMVVGALSRETLAAAVPVDAVDGRETAPTDAIVPAFADASARQARGDGQEPPPPPPPSPPPPPPPPPPSPVQSSGSRIGGQESSGKHTWSHNGDKVSLEYRGAFELNDDDTDIVKVSPGGYIKLSDGGWLRGRSVEIAADASGAITRRFYVGNSERAFEPEGRQWLAQVLLKLIRRSGFAAKERVARFLRKGGAAAVLAEISLLEGSYSKRVYFSQLLQQAPLDPDAARRMLQQAGREIDSDYELASLLISASEKLTIDEATRSAFFEAAGTIDSDYEMRRVYSAVLRRGTLQPSLVAAILQATPSIDSDYEAASLLIDIVSRQAIDGALRAPFRAAVESVGSSYEKSRVLQRLLRRGEVPAETLVDVLQQAARIGSNYEAAQVLVAAARSHAIAGAARDAYVKAAENLGNHERDRALAALVRHERSK
jgi:beta-lactamase regulating signal transducer with metallopeptidase domain